MRTTQRGSLIADSPDHVTVVPYYRPWHYLWFKQSPRNTAWLLVHCSGRERFRVLRGRCLYCGRADCVD